MHTVSRLGSRWIFALGVMSLVFFVVLLLLVLKGLTSGFDMWTYAHMQLFWRPALIFIALVITNFFSSFVAGSIVALLVATFLWQRKADVAFVLAEAAVFGYITQFLTKILLEIPRPPIAVAHVSSQWSFPSGHAVIGTVIFGTLLYLSLKSLESSWKRTLYVILCCLGILLSAGSRVFLGAHWFSDAAAGIAVGVFWLTFFIFFVHRAERVVAQAKHFGEGVRKTLFPTSS